MKALSHIRSQVTLSVIVSIASLLCFYCAIAGYRYTCSEHSSFWRPLDFRSESANEPNAEPVGNRREYLDRLLGVKSEGVSAADFAKVNDAAEALPKSALLQREKFGPASATTVETPSASWTCSIPPPLRDLFHSNVANSARYTTLAPDPSDMSVVYAGGFGGLVKSTDEGDSWQFRSDNWKSQAVTSISIDPNDTSNVYVGTGNHYPPYCVGLYRSTDAGVNWDRFKGDCPSCGPAGDVFLDVFIRAVAVDPNNSSNVYVATDRSTSWSGLWRSTDSGETWSRYFTESGYNGVWALAIDPSTDPSTLYVADSNGVSTRLASDRDTWHNILSSNANWNTGVRLSVVNSVLYLLASDAGICPSPTPTPSPGATPGPSPTHCPINRLYSYTASANPPWSEISTVFGENNFKPIEFAVDPFNPDIILAGDVEFYRTTDAGSSWESIRTQNDLAHFDLHVDQHAIAFSQANNGLVYDGNDGGIWRSGKDGEHNSWDNQNQRLPGILLYGVGLGPDGSMIAATQDNGSIFYNLDDSDGIWKTILGGDAWEALSDPIDGTYSYYIGNGYGGTLRRFTKTTSPNSSDDVAINPSGCAQALTMNLNQSSPSRLTVACTANASPTAAPSPRVVFRTTNATENSPGSISWQQVGGNFVAAGNTISAIAEAPSDPNVIYAIEQYGKVWVTSNASSPTPSWTPAGNPGGISNVTVNPTNPDVAYLACDSGVLKTVNRGASWNTYGTSGFVYRDVAIDYDNTDQLFAASNKGVYTSTDAGVTWASMSDGIPEGLTINRLSFNRLTRMLAAATLGRGVYLVHIPSIIYITAPTNGTIVSGTITLSATASADIDHVQFVRDGSTNIGVAIDNDGSNIFSMDWDTAGLSLGVHTLTAVATDGASNQTASSAITIRKGTIISGNISYCSNPTPGPVPSVTLTLTGSASGSTTTDSSGNYLFYVPTGGTYTVTPSKAGLAPASSGIDNVDVLTLQHHYQGITLLTGCRLAAADANGDGNVTTTDAILVNRFYLNQSLPTGNVGHYQFTPTTRTYSNISSDQTDQNYDTIIFGDVASSYVH